MSFRERRVQRATAVVQLDAEFPFTGVPDDALFEYLGIATGTTPTAQATRQAAIGTSAEGRPIMALRFGDGPRTVLVVGQTHGDEEGGLRVLLSTRTLPVFCGDHAVGRAHHEPRRARPRHPLPGHRRRAEPFGAGQPEQQAGARLRPGHPSRR